VLAWGTVAERISSGDTARRPEFATNKDPGSTLGRSDVEDHARGFDQTGGSLAARLLMI